MKNLILKTMSVLAFAAFFMTSAELSAISTKDRLAIIKALKNKGLLGENNKGFLEFRGKAKAGKVVEEENKIRKDRYAKIAKETKSTIEKVGQQKAIENAKAAEKGHWLQDADGKWYKKK